MMILSSKQKIYIASSVFLVASLLFFGYVFPWIDATNKQLTSAFYKKNIEYKRVEIERQSYALGRSDLAELAKKPYQPENLFTDDTNLVKHIQSLETLSHERGVDFNLEVAGTVSTAMKVHEAKGDIYAIPYTMTLQGSFKSILDFLESMESLDFITHIKTLNITATGDDVLKVVMSANFYIKK